MEKFVLGKCLSHNKDEQNQMYIKRQSKNLMFS
jgi:hypothetical protein